MRLYPRSAILETVKSLETFNKILAPTLAGHRTVWLAKWLPATWTVVNVRRSTPTAYDSGAKQHSSWTCDWGAEKRHSPITYDKWTSYRETLAQSDSSKDSPKMAQRQRKFVLAPWPAVTKFYNTSQLWFVWRQQAKSEVHRSTHLSEVLAFTAA